MPLIVTQCQVGAIVSYPRWYHSVVRNKNATSANISLSFSPFSLRLSKFLTSTICTNTRQTRFVLVGSLRSYPDKTMSARVLSYLLARLLIGSLALGQVIFKRMQKRRREGRLVARDRFSEKKSSYVI